MNLLEFVLMCVCVCIIHVQCRVMTEACRMRDVLEDIMEHIFLNLHDIQKNLQFWQSRAEVSKLHLSYNTSIPNRALM